MRHVWMCGLAVAAAAMAGCAKTSKRSMTAPGAAKPAATAPASAEPSTPKEYRCAACKNPIESGKGFLNRNHACKFNAADCGPNHYYCWECSKTR